MSEMTEKARKLAAELRAMPLTEMTDFPRYTKTRLQDAAGMLEAMADKIESGCTCRQGCRMEDDLK